MTINDVNDLNDFFQNRTITVSNIDALLTVANQLANRDSIQLLSGLASCLRTHIGEIVNDIRLYQDRQTGQYSIRVKITPRARTTSYYVRENIRNFAWNRQALVTERSSLAEMLSRAPLHGNARPQNPRPIASLLRVNPIASLNPNQGLKPRPRVEVRPAPHARPSQTPIGFSHTLESDSRTRSHSPIGFTHTSDSDSF